MSSPGTARPSAYAAESASGANPGFDLAIDLQRVSKTFPTEEGGRTGIRDITLRVARGEMICIVGPSGCGKSTVLNLVAGLLTPEAGNIDFGGATRDAIAAHHIGYMLARDSLLPWRTARANVELALEIRHRQGVDSSARHARAEELLALVGLEQSGALYPRQLSQGMRQRVAIARTLACDPEIFLMDEPFGALDAQTRRLIHEEFLRIWSMSRKSVLFVTHDLMEALVLGDRVIVINGRPGTIVADYSVDIPRDQRLGSGAFAPRLMELHEDLWRKLRQS